MSTAKKLKQNIQFMLNNKGKKTHAVVPIELFEEMFEDYQDWLSIEKRKNEPRASLADFKKQLRKDSKL